MNDKKITRFELEKTDDRIGYASFCRVDIHKGGKVVGVSKEFGKIFLHVIINPNHKKKERWFAIFEEDMPMEDYEKKTCEFIGKIHIEMLDKYLYIFEVHD